MTRLSPATCPDAPRQHLEHERQQGRHGELRDFPATDQAIRAGGPARQAPGSLPALPAVTGRRQA